MDEKQSLAARFVQEQSRNAIQRGFNDASHNSEVESAQWTKGELERVTRDWFDFRTLTVTPSIVRVIRAAYYAGRAIADDVPGDCYKD